MQEVLVDVFILSLFVFLFYAISRGRRDPRLRLWTVAWLCVVAHFVVELWQPAHQPWQNLQAWLSIDALLLAASAFIYSQAMSRLPDRMTRGIAVSLIPATLVTVNLATCTWPSALILCAAVAGRQILAITCILNARHRLQYAGTSVCT